MNQSRHRLSTLHAQRSYAPLVLVWIAMGCNRRLGVSDEPVQSQDLDAGAVISNDDSSTTDHAPVSSDDDSGSHSVNPNDVVASRCDDGIRNGDEGDIDCGGPCSPCAAGFSCSRHEDCASRSCRAGLCTEASCEDGVQNGNETGIDCGGDCFRCLSSTCNCASSPGLSAFSCDETRGVRTEQRQIFVSDDGQRVLYGVCYSPPHSSSNDCDTLLWTQAGTERIAGDSVPLGLSGDGRQMLYLEGANLRFADAVGPLTVPLARNSLLSREGAQVIGITNSPISGENALVRWTRAAGLETLAALPEALTGESVTNLRVDALNRDASAVAFSVSPSYLSASSPFRWTAADGAQTLGGTFPLGPSGYGNAPVVISDDGNTILGYYLSEVGSTVSNDILWRWTTTGGVETLAYAAEPDTETPSLFSNADASVLVAFASLHDGSTGPSAMRWSSSGEASILFAGGVGDMSADGSLIAGWDANGAPLLWTASDVKYLGDITAAQGIDTQGWQLGKPIYVAEDGSFVLGSGVCGGTTVTYRLSLHE